MDENVMDRKPVYKPKEKAEDKFDLTIKLEDPFLFD